MPTAAGHEGRFNRAQSATQRPLPHLPSCGVGVDGDLAGASAVAIHHGHHFLPVDQSFDFVPGRHEFSAFGFLKRFVDEEGVFFHLGSWKLFPYPRRQNTKLLRRVAGRGPAVKGANTRRSPAGAPGQSVQFTLNARKHPEEPTFA